VACPEEVWEDEDGPQSVIEGGDAITPNVSAVSILPSGVGAPSTSSSDPLSDLYMSFIANPAQLGPQQLSRLHSYMDTVGRAALLEFGSSSPSLSTTGHDGGGVAAADAGTTGGSGAHFRAASIDAFVRELLDVVADSAAGMRDLSHSSHGGEGPPLVDRLLLTSRAALFVKFALARRCVHDVLRLWAVIGTIEPFVDKALYAHAMQPWHDACFDGSARHRCAPRVDPLLLSLAFAPRGGGGPAAAVDGGGGRALTTTIAGAPSQRICAAFLPRSAVVSTGTCRPFADGGRLDGFLSSSANSPASSSSSPSGAVVGHSSGVGGAQSSDTLQVVSGGGAGASSDAAVGGDGDVRGSRSGGAGGAFALLSQQPLDCITINLLPAVASVLGLSQQQQPLGNGPPSTTATTASSSSPSSSSSSAALLLGSSLRSLVVAVAYHAQSQHVLLFCRHAACSVLLCTSDEPKKVIRGPVLKYVPPTAFFSTSTQNGQSNSAAAGGGAASSSADPFALLRNTTDEISEGGAAEDDSSDDSQAAEDAKEVCAAEGQEEEKKGAGERRRPQTHHQHHKQEAFESLFAGYSVKATTAGHAAHAFTLHLAPLNMAARRADAEFHAQHEQRQRRGGTAAADDHTEDGEGEEADAEDGLAGTGGAADPPRPRFVHVDVLTWTFTVVEEEEQSAHSLAGGNAPPLEIKSIRYARNTNDALTVRLTGPLHHAPGTTTATGAVAGAPLSFRRLGRFLKPVRISLPSTDHTTLTVSFFIRASDHKRDIRSAAAASQGRGGGLSGRGMGGRGRAPKRDRGRRCHHAKCQRGEHFAVWCWRPFHLFVGPAVGSLHELYRQPRPARAPAAEPPPQLHGHGRSRCLARVWVFLPLIINYWTRWRRRRSG